MTGVYCLANDVAYEHFVALIKSFRKYNSTLPLTVIKFNSKCERLERIADKYQFKIWEPLHGEEMYNIGLKINPESKTVATFFKKICSFWGEYDTFIYLDADIVVTDDFTPILNSLEKSDADIVYWDSSADWVYKAGSYRDRMTKQYKSAHMNAGIFAGKKNALSYSQITELISSLTLADYEAMIWADQSFLNYCCDIKGLKKAPLNSIIFNRAFTAWYNVEIKKKDNAYYWTDKKNGGRMTAIHWAGISFINLYTHSTGLIFLRYRLMEESIKTKYRYFLTFYHIRSFDLLRSPTLLKSLFSILLSA
jgi:lipopolysaccharide biosynthesis glycosyltransferase